MITREYVVHRVTLAKLLRERGGFTGHDTVAALYGHGSENKRVEIERRFAMWLIAELQKLPKGKTASGEASPVRRRGLLSRLTIADIAIALLDYDDYRDGWPCDEPSAPVARHPPTPELIDLLGQLLDVLATERYLRRRRARVTDDFIWPHILMAWRLAAERP